MKVIVSIFVTFFLFINQSVISEDKFNNNSVEVKNSNEAIIRAANIIGLDKIEDSLIINDAISNYIPIDSADLPEKIYNSVNEKFIWQIDFSNVSIENNEKNFLGTELSRTITVHLESLSGNLLKISSNLNRSNSEIGFSEEKRKLEMEYLNRTKFREFPKYEVINFLTILKKCPFSPHLTERIAGICVIATDDRTGESQPVWILSLIGTPPIPLPSPKLDKTVSQMGVYHTAIRVVLDGEKGNLLRGSS